MARFYKRTQPLLCTPYFFSRLGYSSLTFHTRTPLPKRRATLCTSLCTYPQMNVFVRSFSHGGASTLKTPTDRHVQSPGLVLDLKPRNRGTYERLKMAINDGEGTRSRRSPTFLCCNVCMLWCVAWYLHNLSQIRIPKILVELRLRTLLLAFSRKAVTGTF